MAYIIFVNPQIMSLAGMDQGAVFVGTCLAAALACILMGLFANWPIGLAPGMGLMLSLLSQWLGNGLFLGDSSRICFFSWCFIFLNKCY